MSDFWNNVSKALKKGVGSSGKPKQVLDIKSSQRMMDLLQQRYMAMYPQLQSQFYNQWLNSPAYQQGQSNSWSAGNQLQNDLASRMGSMGIGRSGVANIAGPLSRYAASTFNTQLRAGGYNQAQNSSLDFLRMLMAAQTGGVQNLGAGMAQQNQGGSMWGDILGPASLFALGKMFPVPHP